MLPPEGLNQGTKIKNVKQQFHINIWFLPSSDQYQVAFTSQATISLSHKTSAF